MWRKDRLNFEATTARAMAGDWRRAQADADDGTPVGDQRAAEYRNRAEAEEAQAAHAARQADRPWFSRRPIGRPGYLDDIDRQG